MIRGRNGTLAKLRGSGRRPQNSDVNSRLAAITARIDSARNASLTRKPVFDRALHVVAYEIVLGDGPVTGITIDDSAERRQVILNSRAAIDVVALGGGRPVQLTVTSPIVEAELPPELGPAQVMPILGSGVDSSVSVITALERLRTAGYRVVLDDLWANPQLRPLVRLAHAVKVNVALAADPSFTRQIAVLKTSGVELIADRVGSYDDLRNAAKLGFTQFQGSFLSRPDGFRKTRAPAGHLAALELITLLQDPDAEISDIAEVIRRDVSLSYRILKVVNSAHYALPRPLGSIEEAVMLLGTKQIVSWVGMLSMSGINDKPNELTRTAMVRARTCETLGECLARPDVARFYVTGLFSVIEALLDIPAAHALRDLPISPEIVDAITSGNGIMGEVLGAVRAYEEGDWAGAHMAELEDETINAAYQLAMVETDRLWSRITE